MEVRRALVSVSDKSGIVEFIGALKAEGIEVISTGGTSRVLEAAGIQVRSIQDVTEWPEMMDGRVKTLHPRVHGGILARRDLDSDREEMESHGIPPIDLVVVNLYPFEETVAREGVVLAEAIEEIDIGGPTMVRAAAKNHAHVAVVVDPGDYGLVLESLRTTGEISGKLRRDLAGKAFALTARYDAAIANYLEGSDEKLPEVVRIQGKKLADLRYGENPHQEAAFYSRGREAHGLAAAVQHQGKALSFNNLVDADAAYALALDLPQQGCAIIKHTNPCGAGVDAESLVRAYEKALAGDPISAFGGIVAVNNPVGAELAVKLLDLFLEVVIAPGYTDEALQVLEKKKNLRVLSLDPQVAKASGYRVHDVAGGFLLQGRDDADLSLSDGRVVSDRAPTPAEWDALRLSWTLCKHVKSNAIVFSSADQAIGVGAGQMSRIDAVEIAVKRSRFPLAGTAVGSDAFFPFRDTVDALAKAGATAVVQPGGSIRDEEVIQAANEHGLAMVLSGVRHFRH